MLEKCQKQSKALKNVKSSRGHEKRLFIVSKQKINFYSPYIHYVKGYIFIACNLSVNDA